MSTSVRPSPRLPPRPPLRLGPLLGVAAVGGALVGVVVQVAPSLVMAAMGGSGMWFVEFAAVVAAVAGAVGGLAAGALVHLALRVLPGSPRWLVGGVTAALCSAVLLGIVVPWMFVSAFVVLVTVLVLLIGAGAALTLAQHDRGRLRAGPVAGWSAVAAVLLIVAASVSATLTSLAEREPVVAAPAEDAPRPPLQLASDEQRESIAAIARATLAAAGPVAWTGADPLAVVDSACPSGGFGAATVGTFTGGDAEVLARIEAAWRALGHGADAQADADGSVLFESERATLRLTAGDPVTITVTSACSIGPVGVD
ncbi:hypothetical protein HQQ80_11195 [Microbacteriaceae bacterium VKM Ac-2855]|nr:hypothetical protein [Microbacteriaceae bacterium VKM Ac-2855]